jgi:hypothetical protein
VGVAWQTSLIALPIYVVIRKFDNAAIALAVVLVTSSVLKFTWYNHLKVLEDEAKAREAVA